MHGNVAEWCADWRGQGYYTESPTDDPAGPVSGLLHAICGGGWSETEAMCRSASRGPLLWPTQWDKVGFRVALDWADKPEPAEEAK